MTTTRISRVEYFLGLADGAAARSTCPRAKVGAVLTLDNSVIATGYNGAPRGLPHCTDVGCKIINDGTRDRCVRTTHAEANALLQGLQRGSIAGSVLYASHLPCLDCAKLIINARVQTLVYRQHYTDSRAFDPLDLVVVDDTRVLLHVGGITVIKDQSHQLQGLTDLVD